MCGTDGKIFVIQVAPDSSVVVDGERKALLDLQQQFVPVHYAHVRLHPGLDKSLAHLRGAFHNVSEESVANNRESFARLFRRELQTRRLITPNVRVVLRPTNGPRNAVDDATVLHADCVATPSYDMSTLSCLPKGTDDMQLVHSEQRSEDAALCLVSSAVVQLDTVDYQLTCGDILKLIPGSHTGLLSMESVDYIEQNHQLFRGVLIELRKQNLGLLCKVSSANSGSNTCSTTQYYLMMPGELSFLAKRLISYEQTIPLPISVLPHPPEAVMDKARSILSSMKSTTYNPCDCRSGVLAALLSRTKSGAPISAYSSRRGHSAPKKSVNFGADPIDDSINGAARNDRKQHDAWTAKTLCASNVVFRRPANGQPATESSLYHQTTQLVVHKLVTEILSTSVQFRACARNHSMR